MDKKKVKGKTQQLRGKAKQAVGRATGSEETQDQGKFDEAKGIIREKIADIKNGVKNRLHS